MSTSATPRLQTQGTSRMVGSFTLLAVASLIWASQGIAVKFISRHMGPIAVTFVPFWVTTILLIPVLCRVRARHPHAVWPTTADWVRFAIAGIFGQVVAQLGMTWGITKTLVSNATILNLLIPVISAGLGTLMLKERITTVRAAALVIGLAGVLLLSLEDLQRSALFETGILVGNALVLAGCVGSSFYNVYGKSLMRKFSETEILIYSYAFASLASIPLLIWVEPFSFSVFTAFDWKSWAAFLFLTVFMYGVSMLLFFHVLQSLDVTVASASLYLVPVFGVGLGTLVLGESVSAMSFAGAAIVTVSSILIFRYDKV